jgi:hypothetical protein
MSHEGDEKFIQNFGRKAEGQPLGRLMRKLGDNIIKICRKESVGGYGLNSTGSV